MIIMMILNVMKMQKIILMTIIIKGEKHICKNIYQ